MSLLISAEIIIAWFSQLIANRNLDLWWGYVNLILVQFMKQTTSG